PTGFSVAQGLVARAGLLQQQVQLRDLLAQLVAFVLQAAQLVTTHSDIEGLGWSGRHQGPHEHTSQFGLVTVVSVVARGAHSEFFRRARELFCLSLSARSSLNPRTTHWTNLKT